MNRRGWLSGLLWHLRNRLNQTWPGCNEGEGPGCATAWVNSDCFSPGFPNTGNNGTIVPPALIKRRTRDGARSRSGEGRWVKRGQEGRRGGGARASGNLTGTEDGYGGGGGKKREGCREMVRGASLILLFFLHTCVVYSFFPTMFPFPSSSTFSTIIISFLSFPLVLSSILPSCIVLPATYSIPSICPLFLFIFTFGVVRDALPVIPPLHHLLRERGRERHRERKEARKEKGIGRRE